MKTPLLAIEGLHVEFAEQRSLTDVARRRPARVVKAVDGITLNVSRGEVLALVGESGCGKSTTALSVMGLVKPARGRVSFDSRDVSEMKGKELVAYRRRAQLIYQDPFEALDPRFRVLRTVEEPLIIHRLGASRHERRVLVEQALERVGLMPSELYVDRYPHELSGGQRQRLAIAAALALEPELLVADEPVSMLDVSVRAEILALLHRLRGEGLGIMMITHDLATACHYADRVAVMYLGRIVEDGPVDAVLNHPAHPYTRALIAALPHPDPRLNTRKATVPGEPPDPRAMPTGCRFHPRCPVAVANCRTVDPPLENIDQDRYGRRVACLVAASREGSR